MKLTKVFLFSIILSLGLFARDNPFEPTAAFLEERSQIIENKETKETLEQGSKVQQLSTNENIVLEELKPFNFLNIYIYEKKVGLKYSDTKVIRNFKLEDEPKIVIDFLKSRFFLTKRINIDHPQISQVIIGDHPKKNYFRVVFVFKDDLKNYKSELRKLDENLNLVTVHNFNY
jgi:hypothetical protein